MAQSGIFFDHKKSFLNGEVTRTLIRRKNMRQYELARRIRVSPATLTELLDRRRKADTALVAALAAALQVKPGLITSPLQEIPESTAHHAPS